MGDFLRIKIPEFHPNYDTDIEYGYSKKVPKQALLNLLAETTQGYCMYCYTRVRVDRKLNAQLEHSIEKKNATQLIDCVPNIGLACPTCNQSFKKVGEKNRILKKEELSKFSAACECETQKQCTTPCQALRQLQQSYSNQKEAEIILQPMGICGKDTGFPLLLQYDVLKMEFQPAFDIYQYSENERSFILQHISKFHLNDPAYRTRQL